MTVFIVAIGETATVGVCRTRQHVGSAHGQEAGEKCYAEERRGERARTAAGEIECVYSR